MNESQFDGGVLSRAHEAVQVNYPKDALSAMKSLLWEHVRQKNLQTLDIQRLNQFKSTPISIDTSLYDNYRQYYNHPESESHEPLVTLADYKIRSQDVYYKYSQTSLDTLIQGNKLEQKIKKNSQSSS
jgi:hypothetical protein